VKNSYADYKTMLQKEKPHIVSVADRFLDQHRDMVVACARAGASIFLEKPMARTLAEADEMVKACEMHHVKLAIAHQTRYSPRIKQVQQWIAGGKFGDLVEMHARGKEDHRGGGEDMMVLGTHLFDLMRCSRATPCVPRPHSARRKVATKDHIRQGGEGMGRSSATRFTPATGSRTAWSAPSAPARRSAARAAGSGCGYTAPRA